MSLYGTALFVHVVAAILLVGGSAYAHLTTGLIRRARTVDGVRSHVAWLYAFVRASGPMAAVVLLAGLYLAFSGRWWGAGWPIVSLVLFAVAGVAAGTIIEPRVRAIREAVEATPDGPVTAELQASLADTRLTMVAWAMGGLDVAIVFMMTNKPGWTVSLVASAVGLALGLLVGMREVRHVPLAPVAPTA